MSTNIIYKSGTPCYTKPGDESNPFREYLTLESTIPGGEDRFFWIVQDGNGCGGGYALKDIDGWSDADINESFRQLDLDTLRDDAKALRDMGRADDAEWLESWIERADRARHDNIIIDEDMIGEAAITAADVDKVVEALHRKGYTWAYSNHETATRATLDGITGDEWTSILDEVFPGYNVMLKRATFTDYSPLDFVRTLDEARTILTERTGINCYDVEVGQEIHVGEGPNDGPWLKIERA